jgi:hypothetical protein
MNVVALRCGLWVAKLMIFKNNRPLVNAKNEAIVNYAEPLCKVRGCRAFPIAIGTSLAMTNFQFGCVNNFLLYIFLKL